MTSLSALADRFGVATSYFDWSGREIAVSQSTVVAVLAALGVRADTEDACVAALSDAERRYWSHALPPTVIARSGAETSFWVHVDHGDPAHVWIRLEDGTVRSGVRQADNFTAPFFVKLFPLSKMPLCELATGSYIPNVDVIFVLGFPDAPADALYHTHKTLARLNQYQIKDPGYVYAHGSHTIGGNNNLVLCYGNFIIVFLPLGVLCGTRYEHTVWYFLF